MFRIANGCNSPSLLAFWTIRFKTSITKMKSIGERGSSCRRPHRWSNSSPGMPLRITRVDEEPRIALIRSRHLGPKPLFCKISNRKAQETESNALEMSNFGRIRGCFYWWRNLAVCWTRMKLSWMQRPLTNALWLAELKPLHLACLPAG